MAELRGFGAINDDLRKLGVRLLAISVDSRGKQQETALKHNLPYDLLSDEKGEAIRAYGVVHKGGGLKGEDIAIPSYFLIGADGRVLWRRVAARVQDRPDPQTVLNAVSAALGH